MGEQSWHPGASQVCGTLTYEVSSGEPGAGTCFYVLLQLFLGPWKG